MSIIQAAGTTGPEAWMFWGGVGILILVGTAIGAISDRNLGWGFDWSRVLYILIGLYLVFYALDRFEVVMIRW